MESEPSQPKRKPPEFNKKLAAIIAIPLASIALALAGEEKIKQIAIAGEAHLSTTSPRATETISVCEGRQKIKVSEGDNQWSLEQKHVRGADSVFQHDIGTIAIEQHPGDGILEPGDKLIMPDRCERKLKQQN